MARHAAARREDALTDGHPADVVRARLDAHQQHLLAGALHGVRVAGVEGHLTGGGAGAGGQAPGQDPAFLDGDAPALGREDGPQQLVELLRIDAHERLLRRDRARLAHVDGDADRREPSALAVARLQHEEAASLDCELEVLHVAQLALERLPHVEEPLEDLGEGLLQLADRPRRAYAGDHILTLGVHEELAVEHVLTRGGIACERHAGARFVAGVAVHHRLDVDGRAPVVWYRVEATIGDGAVVGPAAEDRRDGPPELIHRVVGEVLAGALFDRCLEGDDEPLEVVRVEIGVDGDALALLQRLEDLLERIALVLVFGLAAEHDVAVHGHEATVAVVGEPRVAGAGDDALHRLVVQAQIEDRVHHARHTGTGPGAHRDQQRIGSMAKRLARV